MAFLRRAERMLDDRRPARLDHALLMAALEAQQLAASAGRERPAGSSAAGTSEDDPLIELILAGPGWRRAASRQRGSFSRAEAGRRINTP